MEEHKILPHPHIGIETLEVLPQKSKSVVVAEAGMDKPGALSGVPSHSMYRALEPEDNLCR